MRHDCVVVPGLGSFVTNEESARYDSARQLFLPPSRSIGFNPEVRHNDAMLIGSVSRTRGVTVDAARQQVETEVASLRHQLQLAGEVPVGKLGMLYRGENPEYPRFEPSEDSLPARRFDGLCPLSISPIQTEEVEEAGHVEISHRTVSIPLPLKIVASVIVVMVALGVLYSTTSLVRGPRMNYASLDTGLSSAVIPAVNAEPAVSEILSREILLNIAQPDPEKGMAYADVRLNNAVASGSTVSTVSDKPGRYILVVGSFPSRTSAERHIRGMGDNSLRIIEMDGNFRVYAASASNINAARSLADSLSEKYASVWVCRR